MCLTMSKKAFLANTSNKQVLINLRNEDKLKSGITAEHSEDDADYKICMLAYISATTKPTAVVLEDFDIFRLMTHHVIPQIRVTVCT